MQLSGVKKINVRAIIIRADGSQEDLGTISSWESSPDNFLTILKNFFKKK